VRIFLLSVTKVLGNGTSLVVGKIPSLLIWPSTQSMRFSMYCDAGKAVGFLYLPPSCQKYSYLKRIKLLIYANLIVNKWDLLPWAATHFWATRFRAIFRNCSVDQIDAIKKVHNMHCKPIVHILAWWKSHHISQIYSRWKWRLSLFVKRISDCSMCKSLLRSKGLKVENHSISANSKGNFAIFFKIPFLSYRGDEKSRENCSFFLYSR
jgi:hypothetical protein